MIRKSLFIAVLLAAFSFTSVISIPAMAQNNAPTTTTAPKTGKGKEIKHLKHQIKKDKKQVKNDKKKIKKIKEKGGK
jgi:hypothetical protein